MLLINVFWSDAEEKRICERKGNGDVLESGHWAPENRPKYLIPLAWKNSKLDRIVLKLYESFTW